MKINHKTTNAFMQVFLFFFVLTLLAGCQDKEEKITEPKSFCLTETMKDEIEFHTVKSQDVEEWIKLTGTVETNPEEMVNFISLVEGLVVNTSFSLGDEVQKGLILAEIRSTELTGMQAERRTLSSQLTVAKRHLESVTSMHSDGIASERDLLQAQSELDVLEADLNRVASNLNLFSSSGDTGVFQIKAPSTGIVIQKNMAPGMQIIEGDALFTISDLNEVWVSINIYAGNIRHVNRDMPVQIKTLSYPDEVFEGNISRLSQVFDAEERVLKAQVVMKNTDFKLKPGMLVDVMVEKKSDDVALAIPTSSLIFENNQNYFLVYINDCEIEGRSADIISANNGWTYINSGAEEGEVVITKNQLLLFGQLKN